MGLPSQLHVADRLSGRGFKQWEGHLPVHPLSAPGQLCAEEEDEVADVPLLVTIGSIMRQATCLLRGRQRQHHLDAAERPYKTCRRTSAQPDEARRVVIR